MKRSDIDRNTLYLKSILSLSSDIIIFLSQDGIITEFNLLAEKYLLWKKSIIIGEKFESLYSKNLIHTPFPKKAYQSILSKENFNFEHALNYANNKFVFLWTASTLSDDSSTSGYIIIGKNITNLNNKSLEKTILQNQLERISSCVPGNFYWKNTKAEYVGCNQTLLNTLGLKSINDLVGKTDSDLWQKWPPKMRQWCRIETIVLGVKNGSQKVQFGI